MPKSKFDPKKDSFKQRNGMFGEIGSVHVGDPYVAEKEPRLKGGGRSFTTGGSKKYHGSASGCFSYVTSVGSGDTYKEDWLREREYNKSMMAATLKRSPSLKGRPQYRSVGSHSQHNSAVESIGNARVDYLTFADRDTEKEELSKLIKEAKALKPPSSTFGKRGLYTSPAKKLPAGVGKPAPILPADISSEAEYRRKMHYKDMKKRIHKDPFRPVPSVSGKTFNPVQPRVGDSYGEEHAQKRKDHYEDMAKRISDKNWKPADQAKSFPEPRFLANYGKAMQPDIPDPPTRDSVAKKKEQMNAHGHEKPWRAAPGGISTRPVISVVEKDLARQYRGKV